MSLMKFFRKYDKRLIAVFGVLLMVAFLLPSALRQMFNPNPAAQELGEAFGEEIKLLDWQLARQDTNILSSLAAAVPVDPTQRQAVPFNWRIFLTARSDDPVLDYMLLVLEAKQMGIHISTEQVNRELAESKIPDQTVQALVTRSGISLNALRETVADYLLVQQAYLMARGGIKASEPELRSWFATINDQLKIAVQTLRASALVDKLDEPTPKQLAAYFAANQERFSFPDRVVVEYLEANVARIATGLREPDPEEIQEYWEDHQDEFTVTTTSAPATSSATQPTQPSVGGETIEKVQSFQEARPRVIELLKEQKARRLAKNTILSAYEESGKLWGKIDERGLKTRPDQVANYKTLARTIGKSYGVPVSYHGTDLISQAQVRELAGIGAGWFSDGQKYVSFDQYAFQVVPLVPVPAPDAQSSSGLLLVLDEDGHWLLSGYDPRQPEAYYMFRVTRVESARLPRSLDEVREKVVSEWKLDQSFKQVRQFAQQLKLAAEKTKLEELADSKNEKLKDLTEQLELGKPAIETFSKRTIGRDGRFRGPFLIEIGMDSADFADRCFEKLAKQPTTQPDGRLTCVLIEDTAARNIYLVQLLEQTPALEKDFQQWGKLILGRVLVSTREREFYWQWFNPRNIRQRVGFADYRGLNSEEED